MSETSTTISVVVPDEDEEDRFFEKFRRQEVPVSSLRDHLTDFLMTMEDALGAIPRALSQYQVDEITLSLEVSATGKVSLVGTGAEVTGTGGLTLTLKRA